jgi:uncharacterized membrane protein YgcG
MPIASDIHNVNPVRFLFRTRALTSNYMSCDYSGGCSKAPLGSNSGGVGGGGGGGGGGGSSPFRTGIFFIQSLIACF